MAKKNKVKAATDDELWLKRLRDLWREARAGDQESEAQLGLVLSAFSSPDAFVKKFNRVKLTHLEIEPPRGMKNLRRDKASKTSWERGRDNFLQGRTSVVGGGLPSLGKRSK